MQESSCEPLAQKTHHLLFLAALDRFCGTAAQLRIILHHEAKKGNAGISAPLQRGLRALRAGVEARALENANGDEYTVICD